MLKVEFVLMVFLQPKNLALGIFMQTAYQFLFMFHLYFSWRCPCTNRSFNKITRNAVKKIKEKYKIKPTEIYAFIGPSSHFSHRIITKERATEILMSEDKITELLS